ncbi:MAG: dihydropteroate synthase [Promethearchaeota archaeon]
MNKIYSKLFNILEVGDEFPTIIMGVLNLSPESFYQSSVVNNLDKLKQTTTEMLNNGALMLDIGARSTAPWSKKITLEEELKRIIPSLELVCKIIPEHIIISIDTQYREIAENSYKIASKYKKKVIINDISNLKTDPTLEEFVIDEDIPIILMASKKIPGDLLTIEDIIKEFEDTIRRLKSKGYDEKKIIIDPGIGRWIKEKTPNYDLRILKDLSKLRILQKPILVAVSRKSFIGATLDKPNPEDLLNGTLSATAIAVYNGAHIVRTHDVNNQLLEITKMAKAIRNSVSVK